MFCRIILLYDFDVQFNFLIFVERDFFFGMRRKLSTDARDFLNAKDLEIFFDLTELSDMPVFLTSKMSHF